jgi:hypothetical protein
MLSNGSLILKKSAFRPGPSQGFSVTSLTLSNMTDWDKELEQFEGKAADLIVLSGIYSGTFLEKLQEYYPEATVVLFAAGEISAQGSVGVVNIDRSPAMVEMGQFFPPRSTRSWTKKSGRPQPCWSTPGRANARRRRGLWWTAGTPSSPDRNSIIQEFFRLRDFVDLTRMIKDILAQTRRPWVSLLTSVMTKDALDQLPPETLVMGEGLKVYLGESPRLLASVEFDYQSLLQKAFEIGKEETPGFHEVPAILWTNDQFAESLEKMAKARQQAEEEAKASELTETRDEGEENEEADAEDANGLEINQEASREEPPVTGQRESTDGTDSE